MLNTERTEEATQSESVAGWHTQEIPEQVLGLNVYGMRHDCEHVILTRQSHEPNEIGILIKTKFMPHHTI